MSYFKAKMHLIRFRLGLPQTAPGRGAYSAPSDTVAGFKGPTSKRKEGSGRGKGGVEEGVDIAWPDI